MKVNSGIKQNVIKVYKIRDNSTELMSNRERRREKGEREREEREGREREEREKGEREGVLDLFAKR